MSAARRERALQGSRGWLEASYEASATLGRLSDEGAGGTDPVSVRTLAEPERAEGQHAAAKWHREQEKELGCRHGR